MNGKYRPTPLLGIPLGVASSTWSSPALPQMPQAPPSPPHAEEPDLAADRVDLAARVELLVDRSRHRLTPMDVQARRFARVRQGRGYDMRQVDQFMDEVQTELTRLHQQIQQLHDQLRQAHSPPRRPGATGPDPDSSPGPDADGGAGLEPATTGLPPLGRVRVLAVQVAADILADALCQAEEIYHRAYQQAAELVADATCNRDPPVAAMEDPERGVVSEPAQSSAEGAGSAREDRPEGSSAAGMGSAAGAVIAGPWEAGRGGP